MTQAAQHTEEFKKAFPARPLSGYGLPPTDNDYVFVGYCRAKQENEQVLKDARKQALEEAIAACDKAITAYAAGWNRSANYARNQIKELLKELL